jgi:putative ABC transport system permease protein
MMLLKIAFRNILRNRRRSAMTGLAIAVGTMALLLFGGLATSVTQGVHTTTVQRIGHLTVFREGYFLFGAGNPSAYGIDDYQRVTNLIRDDAVLRPLISVLTPTQSLFGIAGNFENEASKTFLGIGVIPSDRERMRLWDEYGASRGFLPDSNLSDDDETRGVIGVGLARMLGLCKRLKVPACPSPPAAQPVPVDKIASATKEDFAALARRDIAGSSDDGAPRIDLLSATAGGAPNVVSLRVGGADRQGLKELDDNYVGMHIALAQQLVYGRGEHKVTGIVLQLDRSEDVPAARERLVSLFRDRGLHLEVRSFDELNPFYAQVRAFLLAIFLFISAIMGVIVLFTVVNTMTMTVIERTSEIGTVRAMGVRRSLIRRQFLVEGWLLGVVGAAIGVAVALTIATLINRAGLTWTPPASAAPVPFRLTLLGHDALIVGIAFGLMLVATLAALIPANRAAKMQVVDALRHV